VYFSFFLDLLCLPNVCLQKGHLLDVSVSGSAKTVPFFTVAVSAGLAWIVVKSLWLLFSGRASDRKLALVGSLFALSFALFSGPATFGKFVNLMPFARSLLPFSEFFVHFQMAAVIVAGWLVGELIDLVGFVAQWAGSNKRLVKLMILVLLFVIIFRSVAPQKIAETNTLREKLFVQRKENKRLFFLNFLCRVAQKVDLEGWWGRPLLELTGKTAQIVQARPGRAYSGAEWNWGKDFDIKYKVV
jgi:hypothetical protein